MKDFFQSAARTLRAAGCHPATKAAAHLALKVLLDPLVREIVNALLQC